LFFSILFRFYEDFPKICFIEFDGKFLIFFLMNLINHIGLGRKILIVTIFVQGGASCRAIEGTSTIGRGF